MTSLLNILSILLITEFVGGNVANGFIVLVNCIDLLKRHKLSAVDWILMALVLSRTGLLWIILMNWYAKVRIFAHFVWITTHHFSTWLATCLSIFYLLKIANFSSFLFLYLKWRVKSVILTILLGSLVFLVSYLAVVKRVMTNKVNMTWNFKSWGFPQVWNMSAFTLGSFISLVMSLISFVLLTFSMWKHLRKMQCSGNGAQNSSYKVHIRALQTVFSYILPLTAYILALMISVWNSNSLSNKPVILFCQTLGVLYPSIHSVFLIWGNKKLKEAFLWFLWQLMCWLRERE
ncbi:taste receptor type 2 member 43-like [Erinaceus europaeus]|uniref:Taste receptor type 2 n=1 Tax=Erinaceus europaeus TaxID=9365 RepID=A0ABM3XKY9_ERIEU|nr:taste receptor type 2 member 43-like [Erinaceus europaeus]